MTPVQQAGYKVGDEFIRLKGGERGLCQDGSILRLVEDDETDCPCFILLTATGKFGYKQGDAMFVMLENVKPYNPTTIPYSEIQDPTTWTVEDPPAPEPVPQDLTLPINSAARKEYPMYSGLLQYFPAALAGVAGHSKKGNDKHNPGEPLHHARGKSMDHEDCIIRHLTDLSDLRARLDRCQTEYVFTNSAILEEANALCWRALALSQELHEIYGGAPLAPGAK